MFLPKRFALLLALAALAPALQARDALSCSAASGAHQTALVELYTSEGCSSCPPADRTLAHLGDLLPPGAQAVPVALHVDYWDSLGWTDVYAQDQFVQRQHRLVALNGHHTVYTPHFFVNGIEIANAPRDALPAEIARSNALPAEASVRFRAHATSARTLELEVDAQADPNHPQARLQVVLAQGGLASQVARGENSGVLLQHEHVARTWIGPVALVDGRLHLQRELPLPPGAERGPIELLAFVEDAQSGRPLQAAAAPCTVGAR